MDSKNEKYNAPAVKRVLDILEIMAKNDKRYTVTEMSAALDISINSVFRIFSELIGKGYAIKNENDSSYELTPKLYYLGNRIKNRISFVRTSQKFINNISEYTSETVILTTFGENYKTLVIDQRESPEAIKFISTIGMNYDSYTSALGKAMLSTLSDKDLQQYILNTEFKKITDTTITDKEEFMEQILKIRETNIAFDDEESLNGLSCIACPIFTSDKNIVGAIGISGVKYRMSQENIDIWSKYICNQSIELSEAMGYMI